MQNSFVRDAALIIDIFMMAAIFGSTVWFFFIQSPVLYKAMVRERFVPIQMRLSGVLLKSQLVALVVLFVTAILSRSLISVPAIAAAFALIAGTVNKFVVFPRALRAGGESIRSREAEGETGTAVEFVSGGAGHSATQMHRVVVLFIVLMVAGTVTNGVSLII